MNNITDKPIVFIKFNTHKISKKNLLCKLTEPHITHEIRYNIQIRSLLNYRRPIEGNHKKLHTLQLPRYSYRIFDITLSINVISSFVVFDDQLKNFITDAYCSISLKR